MCHKDPDLWEKPNELYPKHFLDKDGNLDTKNEAFMPFSIGECYDVKLIILFIDAYQYCTMCI